MKSPAFTILFFIAAIFAALYLGALEDIEDRDRIILEMSSFLSEAEKRELIESHELRQFLLERPGNDLRY